MSDDQRNLSALPLTARRYVTVTLLVSVGEPDDYFKSGDDAELAGCIADDFRDANWNVVGVTVHDPLIPLRSLSDIRGTGVARIMEAELAALVDLAVETRALLDLPVRTERWHDQADEVARKLRRFPR